MRAFWFSGATLSMVLTVLAAPATAAAPNAVYTDAAGSNLAEFGWSGSCEGLGTITLTIHRSAGDEVRTASAKSIMEPNPCGIGCLDCPVPFTWTLVNAAGDVELSGGGTAGLGASWSIQGSFQGGALEVHSSLFSIV